MVRFDVEPDEARIIVRIAKRYEQLCGKYSLQAPSRQRLVMDICACHKNGAPLKLTSLLLAPEFDFMGDIGGITLHMNRETGHLKHRFVPRFAKCVSYTSKDDGEP